MATAVSSRNLYGELMHLVRERGLLEKQYGYYAWTIGRIIALLAVGIVLLAVAHSTWVVALDAVVFAAVFGQLAFLGHESAHRQIFKGTRRNDFLGQLAFCLLLGGSFAAWKDKHDAHHSDPNHLDLDPDVDIIAVAFTPEQAAEKRGVLRFIVKYQAYFLIPLLCFEVLSLRAYMYAYLLTERPRAFRREFLLIALHYVWYVGMLAAFLTWEQAVMFVAINYALFGVYLGAVFAPNHKGMPMFDASDNVDFLTRQVVTARNVHENLATDFLSGGLYCQIEHHLFPTMPRNNLRKAASLVREFCEEHGVPYYETGVLQSYREVFQHLHSVSAPLRARRSA